MPQSQPGLDALPIDFVDLALSETTEIHVPENLDDDFAYRVTTYSPTGRRGDLDPDAMGGYFRVDITAQQLRKEFDAVVLAGDEKAAKARAAGLRATEAEAIAFAAAQ